MNNGLYRIHHVLFLAYTAFIVIFASGVELFQSGQVRACRCTASDDRGATASGV